MNKPERTTSLKALRKMDRLVIRVKGKRCVFSIRKELRLPRNGVSLDIHQAEKYAFWRRVRTEITKEVRRAEREYNEARDWATVQMPDALKDRLLPRSESQVGANVRLQPKVCEAKERLDNLRYQEELATMMCEAFEHRRSMLMKVRMAP